MRNRTLHPRLALLLLAFAGCSSKSEQSACTNCPAGAGQAPSAGIPAPPVSGAAAVSGRGGNSAGAAGAAGGSVAGAPALDAGTLPIDAATMSPDAGSAPAYSLAIDAPKNGDTVSGVVTVEGRAPGFQNVEARDPTHQKPPLGRATPSADGAFSFSVDTATLGSGMTTWTIWAWDTAPGTPSARNASVPLTLTIGSAPSMPNDAGTMPPTGDQTIGNGDITAPARGPGPSEAGKIGGANWLLVKNWDFGSDGTIRDIASLSNEFQYHDQFNTIGNGSNYGAVMVAPSAATAIQGQPIEDPARPYRELGKDSLKTYVRPLMASQTNVSASAHNAGCGSIVAKWRLPSGGALLGKDLLWETRARMPVPAAAYWFAIWTAGNKWNKGAEMDVLESFGTPNIYPPPSAFHVNSVGGSDQIDYGSWPSALGKAGVPMSARDLREWHTWTWLYRSDDSFVVYYDGYIVQTGKLHWTLGGGGSGEHIDMSFLIDLGWGHTQIQDVNITLPASNFPLTYELDYSRVYLR
jgi:hypothetical protein